MNRAFLTCALAALGLPATQAAAQEEEAAPAAEAPAETAPAEAAETPASEPAPEASAAAAPADSAREPDTLAAWRERVEGTNLAKASDKVGFAGHIINRAFNNEYGAFPADRSVDAGGTKLDAEMTLKLAINANSFMRVTSMLSFGYDFSGHFLNDRANRHFRTVSVEGTPLEDTVISDKSRVPYVQDAQREGAGVFEDMMASVELKTDPADATLRAGSALWLEGSPLTLWKRDPRPRLVWYYESYEPELASPQYYTQKFFYRRNDLGRLSWPKKAFGGIELDAYRMPGNLGLQFAFAQPSNMLPTAQDGNMNSHLGDAEALGSVNSLGQMYYGRLTRKKAFKDVTVGGNLLWVELPKDIIDQRIFGPNSPQGFRYQFRDTLGRTRLDPWYVNPRVFSLDARGNLNPTTFIHAELAASMDDTVKYSRYDDPATPGPDSSGNNFIYDGRSPTSRKASSPTFAGYVKLNSGGPVPYEAEAFYAGKNFWSPYAMTEYAVPVHRDEIKLGTGSYSYQPNLLGFNVKFSPKVSNGFLAVTLGQHVQPEKGKDVVRFQHTLTGREVWTSSSSWSRTDPRRMLDEGTPFGNPKYAGRVGDHGPNRNLLHVGHQPGGLRGDDLELWEEFAAYDTKAQADAGDVPRNQKYATTVAVDWGWNIHPLIGYEQPILVNLYTMVNAIGTDLTGIANNDKTLLWNALARFEPGITVSPSFMLIGTVGVETFKSDKAWRNILANHSSQTQLYVDPATGKSVPYNNTNYYEPVSSVAMAAQQVDPLVVAEKSPIDYLQFAVGAGFDWDFSSRAGLHVRYKYSTHSDKHLPTNDWDGSFLFGEMKIWF